MKHRLQSWLCLTALAVSSCERSSPPKAGEESPESQQPATTRARREGLDAMPDPRLRMRTALADASRIPDAQERHKAIAAVVWDAHELDPALASEAFELLVTDSPEKIQLVQHFAMRLADQDPEQALEWAASLGSEREIEAARARIALVMADTDPRRAAEILAESAIESRELNVAIVQVLQHWTARNPTEAASWVAVFPAGELRVAGIKTVLSRWAGDAPAAAFAWVTSLSDESMRGDATRAMQEAYMDQVPAARETWLLNAPEPLRPLLEQAVRQEHE